MSLAASLCPNLASPKNRSPKSLRFQIANSKPQLSPQVPQINCRKSHNQIANRHVSKSQIPHCNVFLPVKQQRQVEGAQTFIQKYKKSLRLFFFWGGAISNCSVSAFSKSQRFRDAKLPTTILFESITF